MATRFPIALPVTIYDKSLGAGLAWAGKRSKLSLKMLLVMLLVMMLVMMLVSG